jgi:CheY-like chemotaxis protein
MQIVLVEDDYTQGELIARELRAEFPSAVVTLIKTEKAFRLALEEIATDPPDVFVIDIMLRWTDPNRDHEPAPPDVKEGKFHRAGFRCQKLLERGEGTKKLPVILYSMVELAEFAMETREFPDNVYLMRKEVSVTPLAILIRKVMVG